LIALGFILLLGAVIAVLVVPGLLGGASQASSAARDPESMARVSLADAKAAFDIKNAVFLDVRDPIAFESSRIPGAVSIPLDQIEARLGELDKNDWILTYCT
jgi:hypothetical protein